MAGYVHCDSCSICLPVNHVCHNVTVRYSSLHMCAMIIYHVVSCLEVVTFVAVLLIKEEIVQRKMSSKTFVSPLPCMYAYPVCKYYV